MQCISEDLRDRAEAAVQPRKSTAAVLLVLKTQEAKTESAQIVLPQATDNTKEKARDPHWD